MENYSTSLLLKLLAKLILLQIGAIHAKQMTSHQWDNHMFPESIKNWYLGSGICENVFLVEPVEKGLIRDHIQDLLKCLFRTCPSGTGSGGLPVQPVKEFGRTVGYGFSQFSTWGDHAYADNRRQIITECIEQLQTELRRRKVKV